MAKTFILSDESVNSYGFRVLTDGIDFSRFEKNPIMLWNHSRGWRGTEDEVLPIGRWENVHKENGKLLADAVFDENDEFSKRISDKVKQGIINACSIGICVTERSDDPSVIVPGQRYETVTRCVLQEVSIVDIPSNQNAVALYDNEGKMIELSATGKLPVGLLTIKQNTMSKELNLALGLDRDATEAEAVSRAEQLKALEAECANLKAELKVLQDEKKQSRKAEAEKLLGDALQSGRIDASGKEAFAKLFDNDFDSAKTALQALPERRPMMSSVDKETDENLSAMSWDELDKNEKLQELKEKDPELYRKKFNEKFNKKQ